MHWAHRVRGRFPDGQLYLDLRGFDPSGSVVDPADALRRLLTALGVPVDRIPADLEDQAALYRGELSGRRVLVVLDNARDTAQVRPLLPGSPGCLVLITSRNQLSGLGVVAGAQPITLDLLSVGEARELLAARLDPARVQAEPQAVQEIITGCARLPLALAIVAARAALSPHLALASLAAELRDTRYRLDALRTDDPAVNVRAAFSWSYQALSPAAARLFRLLSRYPGPDISVAAAASLAGVPVAGLRPLLTELSAANLVLERVAGRYTWHDLLREYAADVSRGTDTDAQRYDATTRILDHYLHTGYAADQLLDPNRYPLALGPPAAGVAPEPLSRYEQAMSWFAAEHQAVLAALEYASRTGRDRHTWQLAWVLRDYLDRQGAWHQTAVVDQAALAATQRLGDRAAQAHTHVDLAISHLRANNVAAAEPHLRAGLDLATQAGDLIGQARACSSIAACALRQRDLDTALRYAQRALDGYRDAGNLPRQARTLSNLAWIRTQLGDHHQALHLGEQALRLYEQIGDRDGAALIWDTLGHAHHQLGQTDQAIANYQRTVDQTRRLGLRYYEAAALARLADVQLTAGDRQAAGTAWRRALAIFDDLDHPDAAVVRTKLAGLG